MTFEAPDLATVLSMILAHDLVEIEAGDTFAFDEDAKLTQAERERAAADVVFGAVVGEGDAHEFGLRRGLPRGKADVNVTGCRGESADSKPMIQKAPWR